MEDIIVCQPDIMNGKPIIKGTRITVEIILKKIMDGESIDEILESYPFLKIEQIKAAIKFAIESVEHERIIEIRKAG